MQDLSRNTLDDWLAPSGGTQNYTIGLTDAILEQSARYTAPYTLAVISAWLKAVRPDIQIVYSRNPNTLLTCDEVWCTATSEAWDRVNALGKLVTAGGKRFVAGGHHATALPETLKYGTPFLGPFETYANINELPMPDWSIFSEIPERYVMVTSRGCPYKCRLCSSSAFWRFHERDAAGVIQEIKLLQSLGATDIIIFDDLFIANKRRLRLVAELIVEQDLVGLSYNCQIRSNLVDSEAVVLLRKMNVKEVAFGFESGSDRILELMNKHATVSDHQRAIDLLVAGGYKPTFGCILGYPGETKEDVALTVDFIDRNRAKCNIIDIYPCIPFPGTQLWDMFRVQHHVDLSTFDWESMSINPVKTDEEWTKYFLLTEHYDKGFFTSVIRWNEQEKADLANRLADAAPSQEDSCPAISFPSGDKDNHGKHRDVQ